MEEILGGFWGKKGQKWAKWDAWIFGSVLGCGEASKWGQKTPNLGDFGVKNGQFWAMMDEEMDIFG